MEQVGLEVETIKISKDEMPEDKVESDATTDDSKQSPTEQGKLVFATGERGLPSLNRGYRTPDPSLSRLPKCGALELMVAAENGHADAEFPRAYDTPRERVETKPLNTEPQKEVRTPSPWLSRIRTPSPLLERYENHRGTSARPMICPRHCRFLRIFPGAPGSEPSRHGPPLPQAIQAKTTRLLWAPSDIPTVVGRLANTVGKRVDARRAGTAIIATCANGNARVWTRPQQTVQDAVIRPEVERGKQISFHKEQLIMTWDGVGHSTSLEMAATLNGWMMRYVALS
eukprot:s588_g25.t1